MPSTPVGDHDLLETLSHGECMSLLATVPVGRMAVCIDAIPAVFPVNFAVLDDRIIIRTQTGTKLDAASANKMVAFEVDNFGDHGAWGWSVVVRGVAAEVGDPAELAEVRALPLQAWAHPPGAAERFISIQPRTVSGRWFRRR